MQIQSFSKMKAVMISDSQPSKVCNVIQIAAIERIVALCDFVLLSNGLRTRVP